MTRLRKKLLKRCVLRKVNKIRKKEGLGKISKLPKGQPIDANYCPIALATQCSVGRRVAHCKWRTYSYKLPKCCRNFVERFDNLEFPELIDWHARETKARI